MQQQHEHWVSHSSDISSNGSSKRRLLVHRRQCQPKREHTPLRNGRKAIAQRRHFLMKPLAVKTLLARGDRVCVVQNIAEFWNAATRPLGPTNGLGMSIAEVHNEIRRITALLILLPDNERVYS